MNSTEKNHEVWEKYHTLVEYMKEQREGARADLDKYKDDVFFYCSCASRFDTLSECLRKIGEI